jgi:hypothetical protein
MPHPRQSLVRLFVILGGITACFPSFSYNEDGHFYSVIGAEHLRQPALEDQARDEAVVAAFCTQMPDLARELEAVTVRGRFWVFVNPLVWGAWGSFNFCFGNHVHHMVTAQQYIHALTGSPAGPVTDAAVAIVKRLRNQGGADFDPNRACAVGFGLHLLGDSFAHRRLVGPDRTYPPGLGHVRDLHYPDYVALNSARSYLWGAYARKLSEALDLKLGRERLEALSQFAIDHVGGDNANYFNADAIITSFMKSLSNPPPDQAQVWAPYTPRVEEVYKLGTHILTKSFAEVAGNYAPVLPPGSSALDYRKTWKIFMEAAVSEFKQRDIPSVCTAEVEIP